VQLACENPAGRGEFRVFNQLTQTMSVMQIAQTVAAASPEGAQIRQLPNPRVELEDHYYKVVYSGLEQLGLEPRLLSGTLIESLPEITRQAGGDAADSAVAPDRQRDQLLAASC
jgi:UDP-sulfoquinovose synthase